MLTGGEPAPRLGRREVALLAVVSMLLSAAVALVQGAGENAFGNMGWVHWHEAREVLDGHGFGRPWFKVWEPDLFARPTYTLLLCPFVAVLGRDFETLRVVVAAFQGLLNAVAACAVASMLLGTASPRAARIAAWAVVLHPVLVSQAAALVDTALFTCALVGAYAVAAAVPRAAPPWRWIVAGLVLGVAVLTRSTATMLVPAIVLLVRRTEDGWSRALRSAALLGVGAVVVVAPWFLRNHGLTGRWMLSTVDGVNLWMGNNENTARFLDEERSLDELPGRPRFDSSRQPTVEAQVESCDAAKAAAKEFIRAHPGEAAVLAVRKAGDFWSLTPAPKSTRSKLHGVKDVIGVLWTAPLYLFALWGFGVAWRTGGALRGLAIDVSLTAALFTVPHALAWGGTRLRAPLDPFLVALAAVGVAAVVGRSRRAR